MFKIHNVSNLFAGRFLILASLVLLIVPGLDRLGIAQEAAPSKADLIKTLESTFTLLEKRDFVGASEHFVLPPDFKPEMLDGMIKKREISAIGVEQLAKNAKFGTGSEVFGAERAKQLADRTGTEVSKMYGFYHQTDEATAEVLAVWDGNAFKLARLDDVGKLMGTGSSPADETGPSKSDLIQTLESTFKLLAQEDFEGASKHFLLPPDFKPEMLNGFIKRREISAAGIAVLASDAKFGKAINVIPEGNIGSSLKRLQGAGKNPQQCYGFYHETKEATAQVMALWENKQFKIVALDDVGKLSDATSKAMPDPSSTNSTTDKSSQPTAEEIAAAENERRAKLANAIATLSAHLETKPDDVAARAKYAQALFGIGNTPESWKQLMIAKKLAPNNQGIAGGMDMLINAFTKHGIFVVGVPTETIESLLGEPTQKHESKTRIRYAYGHWAIDFVEGRVHQIIDLRGITETHFSPKEIVDIDLDGAGRRCGFRRTTRSAVAAFYYKPGESIANYTEQFAVERHPSAAKGEIKEIAQRVINDEKKLMPDIEHKILATDAKSAMIAVKIPGPGGDKTKDRHQLVRLMLGDDDLHRITFTIVSQDEPTQETQMKWFKIFQTAKLTKLGELKKSSEGDQE